MTVDHHLITPVKITLPGPLQLSVQHIWLMRRGEGALPVLIVITAQALIRATLALPPP